MTTYVESHQSVHIHLMMKSDLLFSRFNLILFCCSLDEGYFIKF